MFQRTIRFLSIVLALSTATAQAGVKFDRDKLGTLSVTSGESKEWFLPDLMIEKGTGNLQFAANVLGHPTPLPSFLEISGNFLRTKTVAPKPAVFDFVLSVVDIGDPAPEKPKDSNVPTKLTVTPPPPAFKITDKDLGTTPEGTPYSHDIKQYLVDPTFVKTYSSSNIPQWLSIDASTGILSGTPARKDVGNYNFTVYAKNDFGTAQLNLKITVLQVLKHPKWKSNQIDLGEVNEDEKFEKEASPYVENPEPIELTYYIADMTPPPWLKIGDKSGTLYGTPTVPKKYDVAVAFKYKIDGQEYTKATTFTINVKHVNHAPYWVTKPIQLPGVFTSGSPVSANLKNSAADPDPGDTLTFSMTGPAWAKLDSKTGMFSGTPGKSDVGVNKFQVTVSDQAGASDTTDLLVTIVKANEPPVWVNHPTVLDPVKEDSLVQVNLNQAKYVTDPDGDQPLYFTVVGTPPAWLKVSEAGILTGKPGKFDVGPNTIQVKVSDHKSTPDDITDIKIFVEHVNHAPYWTLSPINSTAKEDSAWNLDLTPWAKDDDLEDKLTFSAIAGPSWAQLSAKGIFTGTPKQGDVGTSTWTVRVSDGTLTADVKVIVDVQHVNHPPVWKQPAEIANAKEDQPYSASIKDLASDPDPGDVVRFVKISQKPGWLKVNGDGTVSGTPGANDVGTFYFEVDALDLANAHAVGTIKITVESTNHAPYWRNAPAALVMTDAYEDKTYKFDLTPHAADPDANDKLTFSLVTGPSWMFVGGGGDVSGVPTSADVGNQTARLKVTDAKGLSAETDATIVVIHTNHPPVISPSPIPTFVMNEREVKSFDLKEFIKDSDNDPLTCTKQTAEGPWAELGSDCIVKASPKRPQVQATPHTFDFKVSDKQTFITSVFRIQVNKVPQKPIWLSEPITANPLNGETNVAFSGNIADRAKDLDGEKLTFKKASGPDWLIVNADGSLSGTPKDANEGLNSFKLVACNPDLCSDEGTLQIKVKISVQIDTVQIDTKVPGAPSEYMWDMDNSDHCDKTMRALKQNIGIFYDKLKAAELHHFGIMLSSDVKQFGAEPIRNKNTGDPMLLKWDANNLVSAWRERLDLAYSVGHCNNCNSSPIWAMYRFFERLPNDFTEIYRKDYFMPSVPSDSMMVSHQMDHYKYYTKNLPEPLKNYTPNDFARDFIQIHRKEEKSFRVSAIAPECPTLLETSGDPQSVGPSNSFATIVNKTGGKYYTSKCDFNAVQVLNEFADAIIFRAYVHAKQRVKLSKVPSVVSSIKVKVGGVTLPPPTGSSGDKWTYDAGTNEIVLKWYLIDEGQLKPGQKIEIEYRVG